MSQHQYDNRFFDYIDAGSRASARALIPLVYEALAPQSVVDVGCGRGVWVAEWRAFGVHDSVGIDGSYVDQARLLIPPDHFCSADLSGPIDLGRRFDLVQSLEVAEHLPPACSEEFIDNLVRHGDVVLFSAAVPGQGGESHINERTYDFWRLLFRARGYRMFDPFRRQLLRQRDVEPWYRFNTFLFVMEESVANLTPRIVAQEISLSSVVPDVSSLAWKLRRGLLKQLPVAVVTTLSRAHQRMVIARQSPRYGHRGFPPQ